MTDPDPDLDVQQCATCGHRMYPPRLGCSRCGGHRLRPVPAGEGTVVDTVEILRSPGGTRPGVVVIALVELAGGVRLLAGAQAPLPPGSAVTLARVDGAPRVRT